MNSITVFCGSSLGSDNMYKEQAYEVGKVLAGKKMTLVYGGAKYGLMGAVADGVLNNKGKVIGVLPHFLKTKEVAHQELTELIIVDTMHERKAIMNELCDGFITLPGGFGTMEELFEIMTWSQLGLHGKPIGLLNVNGFYDTFIAFIQSMVDRGFVKEVNQKMLLVSNNIDDLLHKMANYTPPLTTPWITEETT
ncbi:MAG: TIGR00730 family Rossman fold protein [Bacteroidota bacterium]